MPKDLNVSCCLVCCCAPPFIGAVSGVVAFNTWLGGVILKSAGWAPVAISHLPAVGAAGAAAIAGPILCCACLGLACSDEEIKKDQEAIQSSTTNTIAANAILGGAYGATGAAMLGYGGEQLGFAAASGAIGGAVGSAALGVGLLGAICCCGSVFICCAKGGEATMSGSITSRISPIRDHYYIRASHPVTFDTPITQAQMDASLAQNGRINVNTITEGLTQNGLHQEAAAFRTAHNNLMSGNFNHTLYGDYNPSAFQPRMT